MRVSFSRRLRAGLSGCFALALLWLAAAEGAPQTGSLQSGQAQRQPNGPTGEARTNRAPFEVSTLSRMIHGGVQVQALIVGTRENQFSLHPPRGWRVLSQTNEFRIRLVNSETGSQIGLRFREERKLEAQELKPESARAQWLARHPGARVVDEFGISALGQPGLAFDLEWRGLDQAPRLARCASIPYSGGILECSLATTPERLSSDHHSLNQLLLSLRRTQRGEPLQLQPITPE